MNDPIAPAPTQDQGVTLSALARELGKSPEEVLEMVDSGALPAPMAAFSYGGSRRLPAMWSRSELERHARGRAEAGKPAPPPSELVGIRGLCRELGKEPHQVAAMVKAGMLPAPRLAVIRSADGGDGGPLWSRDDLDKVYQPARGGQVLKWLARTAGALGKIGG